MLPDASTEAAQGATPIEFCAQVKISTEWNRQVGCAGPAIHIPSESEILAPVIPPDANGQVPAECRPAPRNSRGIGGLPRLFAPGGMPLVFRARDIARQ